MTLRMLCLVFFVSTAFAGLSRAADPAPANIRDPSSWKIGLKIVPNLENRKPSGVKITEVFPDSPGQKIRLMAGDVLHAVDGKLFNDPKALRDDVMGKDRDRLTLVWQRGDVFLEQQCEVKGEVVTEVYTTQVDGIPREQTRKVRRTFDIAPLGEPQRVADPRIAPRSDDVGSGAADGDGPRRVPDPRAR